MFNKKNRKETGEKKPINKKNLAIGIALGAAFIGGIVYEVTKKKKTSEENVASIGPAEDDVSYDEEQEETPAEE